MELDLAGQTQIWLGLYERETYHWLRRFCGGLATGIDVGSAEGAYTLFLLAETQARRVIAFEPLTESLKLFRRNLALNGYTNDPRLEIRRQEVGPSDSNGRVTLDSLAPLSDGPCLVKIDVDGPEASILRGAELLLANPQTRWLIETHSADLERECVALLQQHGFVTRIVDRAWWRVLVPEGRPIPHNRWLVAASAELI